MSPGYDLCPSVSSVVPVFTLARTKASIEAAELSGIAARRIRPDRVSRYFALFRLGLARLVPRSMTSTAPAIRIFPDFTGSKKLLSARNGISAWSTSTTPSSGSRCGSIIDRLSFCASNQAVLYVMPSWASSWTADMPLEWVGCHEMRGPEPYCQRQLGPVHRRPGRDRRLATAVKAFVGVRPALQQRGASAATGGADKPLWPTPLKQERRAARLVRKARLKLAQRSRPSHPMSLPPDADRRRTAPSYYILTYLGQRDEPYRWSPINMSFLGRAPTRVDNSQGTLTGQHQLT